MPKKGTRRITPAMRADSLSLLNGLIGTLSVLQSWHSGNVNLNTAKLFLSLAETELQAQDVEPVQAAPKEGAGR